MIEGTKSMPDTVGSSQLQLRQISAHHMYVYSIYIHAYIIGFCNRNPPKTNHGLNYQHSKPEILLWPCLTTLILQSPFWLWRTLVGRQ